MPKLARWYAKSAMIYLVSGAIVAALALSQALPLPPGLLALRPLAWHLLTVGWATQLIFGVAFWMFPRVQGQRPRREWGWMAFALINAGLLLRVLAQPIAEGDGDPVAWRVLLGVAAVLPVLGVMAFGVSVWPRVRTAA